jgi:hypothetical protein
MRLLLFVGQGILRYASVNASPFAQGADIVPRSYVDKGHGCLYSPVGVIAVLQWSAGAASVRAQRFNVLKVFTGKQ